MLKTTKNSWPSVCPYNLCAKLVIILAWRNCKGRWNSREVYEHETKWKVPPPPQNGHIRVVTYHIMKKKPIGGN
jgi:hypothetical protein